MAIRVFVLDDHELVRTGLHTLLEAEDDMQVVGEAGTAEQGLKLIRDLEPDVAILDVRLPDGNGIEVCREIQSTSPQVRCLMLTSYSDDDALFSSIMAGASGYVLKEVGSGDLLGDIRRVSQGMSLLDPLLTQELFDRLRKDQEAESRLTVADAPGTQGPGAHRPGPVEPPDRGAALPGRGNGEELRLEPAVQARHAPADRSRGVRRRPGRAQGYQPPQRLTTSAPDRSASGHLHPAMVVQRPEVDTRATQEVLQALTLGERAGEPGRVALDAERRAQPQEHAVVIELERQILRHDVAPVVTAVQPAPALQEHHDQLVTGRGAAAVVPPRNTARRAIRCTSTSHS